MELTTIQLCALLAIALCTVGLLHLKAIRNTSTTAANAATEDDQLKLIDMQRHLEWQEYELKDLRDTIRNEALDHAEVERGLLQLLAAAAPLTDEDQAALEAMSNELELAADTFATLPQTSDHSQRAHQLASYALHMARRLEVARANARPHPDTELIDWLSEHGTCWNNGEHAEIRIPVIDNGQEHAGLRHLLRLSMVHGDPDAPAVVDRLDAMAA